MGISVIIFLHCQKLNYCDWKYEVREEIKRGIDTSEMKCFGRMLNVDVARKQLDTVLAVGCIKHCQQDAVASRYEDVAFVVNCKDTICCGSE